IVLDLVVVLDHVVAACADHTAEERSEGDLIGPVDRLAELAQPACHERAAGEEAQREADAEGLDRDAEEFDFGLHGVRAPDTGSTPDSRAPGFRDSPDVSVGHVMRPGSGGQRPESLSLARAMSASGVWKPKARRVIKTEERRVGKEGRTRGA